MSILGSIGRGLAGVAGAGLVLGPTILGGGLGGIGGLAGIAGGNRERNDALDLAQRGSDASNPLTQPQRFGMQDQLSRLLAPGGGSAFLANDPTVQAQQKMIGDWAQANFAKSGNFDNTAITGASQLANVYGQQYNQRIQDLLVGGGFTQNNNYGGMPFSAAQNPTLTGTQTQLGGIGNLLGMIPGLGSLLGGGGGGVPGGGMGMGSVLNAGPTGIMGF